MSEYKQTMTVEEMAVVSEICGVGMSRTGCGGIELNVLRQRSMEMIKDLPNKDEEDKKIINDKIKLCEKVIDGYVSGILPRAMVKKVEFDKLADAINNALSNESDLQDKTESEKIDYFFNRKKAKGDLANVRLIFSEEEIRKIIKEKEEKYNDSKNVNEELSDIINANRKNDSQMDEQEQAMYDRVFDYCAEMVNREKAKQSTQASQKQQGQVNTQSYSDMMDQLTKANDAYTREEEEAADQKILAGISRSGITNEINSLIITFNDNLAVIDKAMNESEMGDRESKQLYLLKGATNDAYDLLEAKTNELRDKVSQCSTLEGLSYYDSLFELYKKTITGFEKFSLSDKEVLDIESFEKKIVKFTDITKYLWIAASVVMTIVSVFKIGG